jgi:hypothetical protein
LKPAEKGHLRLARLRDAFGAKVECLIRDERDRVNPKTLEGWQRLDTLKSNGAYEDIKQRFAAQLDRYRCNGGIDDDAFRESAGKKPLDEFERVGSGDVAQRRANEHGRGIPEDDRGAAFLTPYVYRVKTLVWPCTTTSRIIERQRQNRRHIAMLMQYAKDFDAIVAINIKN